MFSTKVRFHYSIDEENPFENQLIEWKWLSLDTLELKEYSEWKFIKLKYKRLLSFLDLSNLRYHYNFIVDMNENSVIINNTKFYQDIRGYIYTYYDAKKIYVSKSVGEFLSRIDFELKL